MTALLPIARPADREAQNGIWTQHLAVLGTAVAALLVLFRRDAGDMVRIWFESSTFNHCALILPIIAWLVWQRRRELRQLRPHAWTGGLLIVAAGALFWLVGWAAGVALARHFGLVIMLQGIVVACLGKAVSRGLAFPLFFAFFLVPAGEEIVPIMQTVTAHMCMALLGLVGIPAHLEGVFISTPAGYFEVAEACSGVKFLVAMVAFGALAANVCFRSWRRRLIFMAAAVAIPILANGVRAWATIYVASFRGADVAEGFDHVLYGWIFFAIVIALLMGAGWRYFDRGVDDPWFEPADLQDASARTGSAAQAIGSAAVALAIAAAAPAWAGIGAAQAEAIPPLAMPQVVGWERVAPSGRPWQPHFAGADRIATVRYRNERGLEVDLAVAVFARQEEGREVLGFGQGAVGPDSAWSWTASGVAPPGGRLDRIVSFGTIREVATFYRVGGVVTGSPLTVKYETMKARLAGGPQGAVAVLVSAEAPGPGLSPRPAIDSFLSAMGPVDRLADRLAGSE